MYPLQLSFIMVRKWILMYRLVVVFKHYKCPLIMGQLTNLKAPCNKIWNEKKMSTHSSERRWGNKNVWLREHFLVTLQNIFSSIFRWIFIISFFSLLLDFATRLLTVLRAKISANQETVWCFASNHQQLSNLITQNLTHMPHTPRSTTLLVWSNHIHNNHKRKHYVDKQQSRYRMWAVFTMLK